MRIINLICETNEIEFNLNYKYEKFQKVRPTTPNSIISFLQVVSKEERTKANF